MKKFNKKVTIVDIAKELGVSTAMVSMVLSGNGRKHRISNKASLKVIETARRLGYNPNLLARALRTGKTGVLGLIIADISNPFFAILARLIENEASRYGYDVMFASSDERAEKFTALGNAFLTKQVDGLIIVPVVESENIISEWQSRGIPIVSIDRYFSSLSVPYAVTDNFDASFQILKYITKRGYKKIAFVAKNTNLSNFAERENGFTAGAKHLNLKSEQYTVFKLDHFNREPGIDNLIKHILNNKFDIIFFSQNMIGIQGLSTLNKLNVSIPNEMAVISFDDSAAFEFNKPGITCFEQPLDQLAKKTLNYLIDMIDDRPGKNKDNEKFKGRLIIRESC